MWKQRTTEIAAQISFFEAKEIALKYLHREHFGHSLAWQ
jgi:hypothetical protein